MPPPRRRRTPCPRSTARPPARGGLADPLGVARDRRVQHALEAGPRARTQPRCGSRSRRRPGRRRCARRPSRTTSRAAASRRRARVPKRISIPCSSHHPGGRTNPASRSCSPRRSSFDSGGRSYGGSPRRRSAPAARRAPGPAGRPRPSRPRGSPRRRRSSGHLRPRSGALRPRRGRGRSRAAPRPAVDDRAGRHVEDAAVALAFDLGAVDLAAWRVAAPVGAGVAERVQLALDPGDGDPAPADLEGLDLPSATSSARRPSRTPPCILLSRPASRANACQAYGHGAAAPTRLPAAAGRIERPTRPARRR